MKVRDIMTTDPVKVTGNTHLKEAARLMVRHRVSGLPVVDDAGKLIGILSEGDFIRREAGRDRPQGVSLLDAVFGEGWEAGHQSVKEWAKRIEFLGHKEVTTT